MPTEIGCVGMDFDFLTCIMASAKDLVSIKYSLHPLQNFGLLVTIIAISGLPICAQNFLIPDFSINSLEQFEQHTILLIHLLDI